MKQIVSPLDICMKFQDNLMQRRGERIDFSDDTCKELVFLFINLSQASPQSGSWFLNCHGCKVQTTECTSKSLMVFVMFCFSIGVKLLMIDKLGLILDIPQTMKLCMAQRTISSGGSINTKLGFDYAHEGPTRVIM